MNTLAEFINELESFPRQQQCEIWKRFRAGNISAAVAMLEEFIDLRKYEREASYQEHFVLQPWPSSKATLDAQVDEALGQRTAPMQNFEAEWVKYGLKDEPVRHVLALEDGGPSEDVKATIAHGLKRGYSTEFTLPYNWNMLTPSQRSLYVQWLRDRV